MKISIIVLTFNEIEGVKLVFPRIRRDWYNELIIADGGSTDGTLEYFKQHGHPFFIQKEKGVGAAFVEALARINGDIGVIFCPDGNFVPETIPDLIEFVKKGYDISSVSRYCNGGRSYDDDICTGFGNWFFTKLTNILFKMSITDSLYGYFAFKRDRMSSLNINKSLGWCLQILIRAHKNGLKIIEVPGEEPKRIGGHRKMSPLKNGLSIIKILFKEYITKCG